MYSFDIRDDSLILNGVESGIAPSPYAGISSLQNVNISTIPGEASVAFATKSVLNVPVLTNYGASVTTTGNNLLMPVNATLESYQWVIFSTVGTSGLTAGIPYMVYWNGNNGFNTLYQLYVATAAFPASGTAVTISANSSVTFSTLNPSIINFFQSTEEYNFAIDSKGRVWSDRYLSGTGGGPATSSWVYIGNTAYETDTSANGNGLLVFRTVHDGTGGISGGVTTGATFDEWLFVWRNAQIDYTQLSSGNTNTSISWVNGWNYGLTTGTTYGYTGYLETLSTVPNPHHAIVTPDARVNFCDGNFIGNWYQNIPAPGNNYVGFNPQTAGTWTPQTMTAILPADEVGQCLAFVNQYLLIGTKSNIIYPWDLNPAHNTYSVPVIMLPETNTQSMVTVGQNAYIFAGNRGNIYITNGSQASLWSKVPDHISEQVEPLFQWGAQTTSIGVSPQCSAYNKNRLYFGITGNYQAGGNISNYGGIWQIDIASQTLSQLQQLSYGTNNGFLGAVAVSSKGGGDYNPNIGYGLIAGWSDGSGSNFGIDVDIATPYTGGEAIIDFDLIPIGTFNLPRTNTWVEYKLSTPMVSGESIALYSRNAWNATWNLIATDSTVGNFSNSYSTNWNNAQWLQMRAVLTSTGTTPSYVRLKELRVGGFTGPAFAQEQILTN